MRIRYIALVRSRLRATAGGFVRVRVSTDARRVTWRLGGRSGICDGSRVPDQGSEDAETLSPRPSPARGHHAGGTVVVVAPP